MTDEELEARLAEVHASSVRKIQLVNRVVSLALGVCGPKQSDLFELAVASPGIVMTLFFIAMDCIDDADVSDEAKQEKRELIRLQVVKLMATIQAAIDSDDPLDSLKTYANTLYESFRMGETEGVH